MRILGLLFIAALVAACSSVTTQRAPSVNLDRYKIFFVERQLNDNHRLDELIVEELHRLGRTATSGPLTMKPDNADAVVTYNDRWAWDFKNYMIELNLDIHDARNDKPLTTGRYYQPSITTKNPPEMIRDILEPLLGKPK